MDQPNYEGSNEREADFHRYMPPELSLSTRSANGFTKSRLLPPSPLPFRCHHHPKQIRLEGIPEHIRRAAALLSCFRKGAGGAVRQLNQRFGSESIAGIAHHGLTLARFCSSSTSWST